MRKSTRADGVVVSAYGRGLVSQAGAVLLRETMGAAVLARAACQLGWPGGGRRGRPVTRGKVIADLAAAVAPGGGCLAAITVPRGQPELAGPVASKAAMFSPALVTAALSPAPVASTSRAKPARSAAASCSFRRGDPRARS